jgi:hypothetical protein
VFTRGYWESLLTSASGLPAYYNMAGPVVFGGEYYMAVGGHDGSNRKFGLFKWDGSAWTIVGSYVTTVNWGPAYPFLHNGELWILATGSGTEFYKLASGSVTLVTTAYSISIDYPMRGMASVGSDLYVADGYGSGGAIAKWDGSTWTSVGTMHYADAVCYFDGSLYCVGEPTGSGASYDYRILKWNGSAWVAQTYAGDASQTYLYPGTDDLYAVDSYTGSIYHSTGGAFSDTGEEAVGTSFSGKLRDAADGRVVLGLNTGELCRLDGTTFNEFTDTTVTEIYSRSMQYEAGTLYTGTCSTGSATQVVSLHRWVGDLP